MKILFALAVISTMLVAVSEENTLETSVASPIELSLSDRVLFSNSKDPVDPDLDPTNVFTNEARLGMQYKEYSENLQMNSRFSPNGVQDLTRPFVIEKKRFTADWTQWQVHLGDSHQELGRGIAFSVFENPTFGTDNTVEGAAVRFHPDAVDFNMFGGRLNALKAPAAVNAADNPLLDRQVYVGAASLQLQVIKDLKFGGHYLVAFNQPDNETDFDGRWDIAGLTYEQQNIGGEVDVYAESNLLLTHKRVVGELQSTPDGWGSYASFSWAPAAWKVKTEIKDFRGYHFEFRRPPRLDEDLVLALNDSEITASKVSVEHVLTEDAKAKVFASYLLGEDREIRSAVQHPVAGVRFPMTETAEIEVKAGYRWAPDRNNLSHASMKTKIKTFKGQSLEAGVRVQRQNKQLHILPINEERNMVDLTYSFNERFNISLGYEFIPTNDTAVGNHFANVGAMYRAGALATRGFLGNTSGGTQCSGGQCREIPPYTGAFLDTTYTF